MNWKMAKNYIIISLFIVNLLLFVLNIIKSMDYKISNEQVKNIENLLDKSNIEVYCNLPKSYFPMRQIKTGFSNYDYLSLQQIFFENIRNIIRTEEFNTKIFSSENETLSIENNLVKYTNKTKNKNFLYTKENILKICETYVDKIKKLYTKFELDIIIEESDHFLVTFTKKYDEFLFFSNYITFKIYENGEIDCEFSYTELKGEMGNKTSIVSSDEALFAFYHNIKNLIPTNNNKKMYIRKVDLGYYLSSPDTNIAIPHYRIFLKGIEDPFYINAYSNQ